MRERGSFRSRSRPRNGCPPGAPVQELQHAAGPFARRSGDSSSGSLLSRGTSLNKPQPPANLWQRLNALAEQCKVELHPRPGPEWFTIAEYAAAIDRHQRTARGRLTKLLAAGRLERVRGKGTGYYFRLKEGK